ncbi:12202_t:CDS:2, partial [Dentiscutata erythropus]
NITTNNLNEVVNEINENSISDKSDTKESDIDYRDYGICENVEIKIQTSETKMSDVIMSEIKKKWLVGLFASAGNPITQYQLFNIQSLKRK